MPEATTYPLTKMQIKSVNSTTHLAIFFGIFLTRNSTPRWLLVPAATEAPERMHHTSIMRFTSVVHIRLACSTFASSTSIAVTISITVMEPNSTIFSSIPIPLSMASIIFFIKNTSAVYKNNCPRTPFRAAGSYRLSVIHVLSRQDISPRLLPQRPSRSSAHRHRWWPPLPSIQA